MAELIRMPAVAADSAGGSLAQWLKQEGDRVAVGDAIAEIETDKAIVEINAEHAGILARVLVTAGPTPLAVNAVLGVLADEGEGAEAIARALSEGGASDGVNTEASGEQAASPPTNAARAPVAAAAVDAIAPVGHASRAEASAAAGTRLLSSPAARRMAAERGVDLKQVRGSGPAGRILRSDVQDHAENVPLAQHPSNLPPPAPDSFAQRIPHSTMRRAIARRLTASKQTIPHFYLTLDCRMDALLALREHINVEAQTKISVNDFIVRATALALVEVPQLNVSWEDDALVQHAQADVAVAVATEGGLVTPIVRDAAGLTLLQVAGAITALATRARAHRLQPDDYTGGSITVSNLGMHGVTQFAAIINPPQAAILAVGAAAKRAVVSAAGELEVATIMTVTLSADHRAVDGAVAARWLAAFKRAIEHPVRILL